MLRRRDASPLASAGIKLAKVNPEEGKAVTAKWFLPAMALVLRGFAASTGYGGSDTPDPGIARDFSAATLAEVDPGHTTKAQVEALLGEPWRTTFSDDSDEPGPVVWEYRGQDSDGTYRVHIEFDSHDITTLIATIPDKIGAAPARVAKPPPAPEKPQK